MFIGIWNEIVARIYCSFHAFLSLITPISIVLYTQRGYGYPTIAEQPNISILPKLAGRLLRRLDWAFRNR